MSPKTLDLEAIERVVTTDGHYLGEGETLKRMKTDYHYPALADRQSVNDWIDAGSLSIWDQARSRVADIIATATPTHLSAQAEAQMRARFPIRP